MRGGKEGDCYAKEGEIGGVVGVEEDTRNNHRGEQQCAVVTSAQCSIERGAAY